MCIPYLLSAHNTKNDTGLDGEWGTQVNLKISVEVNEEGEEAPSVKPQMPHYPASPYEYTLYLLTVSPSLFCSPWLIAPFNLHVCEMRGLECTLAWLCALLAQG